LKIVKNLTISLRHNKLRSIDLTPLKSCTNLREIYLDYNQLDSINLSPLASCTTLRKISLCKNQLRTIDALPLSKCPYLEELDIEHNNLTTVDLAPLSACHSLSSLGLIDGNSLNLRFSASAWAPLRAIAAGSLNQIQTQYVLFNNLHLLNFGMIDSHLLNEISSIPSDTPIDIAKEDIKSTLIQKMCDQIDNGGTTIGLDIDDIVKEGRYTDLIVRAKKVIDLRKEEMNRVEVTWDVDVWEGRIWGEGPNDGPDKYDLRALWLTAYGYRILCALGMQQSTDERNLRRIKAACKKIGHDLLVEPSEFQIPREMSSHLQELILNLVDTH
jgi:Leucine-rich repeat (LRR) protein